MYESYRRYHTLNYMDVYFSRASHRGKTVAEVATNTGIRSFEKWLEESPNVPANDLQIEDKCFFRGVILSKKDDENKKIKELHVALDVPVEIGDIVIWDDERWLVYQKERRVRETHKTFYIVRCNYYIKWVDNQGHLQGSWCYFVSSMDSKIKENFRTWNNLITPQPNKYAEFLLPKQPIDRLTKFIVEEEGWYLVELDKSSVPGVMYLSATEDKINYINDDLKNEIGDVDKLAKYDFVFPEKEESFKVGAPIDLTFSIMKDGKPIFAQVSYTLPNRKVVGYDKDKNLIAVAEGEVEIEISLKDNPEVKTIRKVIVSNVSSSFSGYIKGNNTIRLDRKATYELITTEENPNEVIFTLEGDYASIVEANGAMCAVKANAKNKLGKVILRAESGSLIVEKEISIVPLW